MAAIDTLAGIGSLRDAQRWIRPLLGLLVPTTPARRCSARQFRRAHISQATSIVALLSIGDGIEPNPEGLEHLGGREHIDRVAPTERTKGVVMKSIRPSDEIFLAAVPDLPPIARDGLGEAANAMFPKLSPKPAVSFADVFVKDVDWAVGDGRVAGAKDVATGPDWRLIDSPWEYSDPNAGSDWHLKDKISAWANAGPLAWGDVPDESISLRWMGLALSASRHVRVEVTPFATWLGYWTLRCAGIAGWLVGDPATVHLQAEAQLQAFDTTGPVSPLAVTSLLHTSHSVASGMRIDERKGEDGGAVSPPLRVSFDIPGGQTRWVNVLLRTRGYANYSPVYNQCGVDSVFYLSAPGLIVKRL